MRQHGRPTAFLAVVLAAAGVSVPGAGEAAVVDQQQPVIDGAAGPLAIGGASEQILAQVVTVGLAGPLVAVRLPVGCSDGGLVVEIRGVSAALPNGIVMTSQTVAAADLPPFFPDPPAFRTIAFSAPPAFAAGDELAIVLRSPGTCGLHQGPPYEAYAGGSAYFDSRPNPPGIWVALGAGLGPADDLPFQTLVRVQRTVGIDIRPRNPRNVIRPGTGGFVDVAALSEAGFDATTVDPVSVAFGPGGAAPVGVPSLADVDRDGLDDLVLTFRVGDTGITCGDTSATLAATTTTGVGISGEDGVMTVGCRP